MVVSAAKHVAVQTFAETDMPTPSPRAAGGAASTIQMWARDVIAAVEGELADSRTLLICGAAEDVHAVAAGLPKGLSVTTQRDDEAAIAFIDRSAGADCDDQISGVLCLDRGLDRQAATEISANLRAVMDRCFHDAPVIVVAGERAQGALGIGPDRILAV